VVSGLAPYYLFQNKIVITNTPDDLSLSLARRCQRKLHMKLW
jgi:hypothetical protein